MTVFDTLRWPVTRDDIVTGDLLDRLPPALVREWWDFVIDSYGEAVTIKNYDHGPIRWWVGGLNRIRFVDFGKQLELLISKWDG